MSQVTDGVLLVDKPPGPTSHDVVARARAALDMRKVGHTGTLDPFASGLLVLCLERSTRIAEYLSGLDKVYRATARLGATTSTDDLAGEPVEERGGWEELDEAAVAEALARFGGEIEQVPPQYSAKRVGGERMYRKARRGELVELAPVRVTVHHIELVELALPDVTFTVSCSSGTYVRALARDLGGALGTGGYLTELRRTAVGGLTVEDALPWTSLEPGLAPGIAGTAFRTPAQALAHLPTVRVSSDEAGRLAHGQPVTPALDAVPEHEPVAVLVGDRLVAVGYRSGDALHPRKVLA